VNKTVGDNIMKESKAIVLLCFTLYFCGCTTSSQWITPDYVHRNQIIMDLLQNMSTNQAIQIIRAYTEWEYTNEIRNIEISTDNIRVELGRYRNVPAAGHGSAPPGWKWVSSEYGISLHEGRFTGVSKIEQNPETDAIILYGSGTYFDYCFKKFRYISDGIDRAEWAEKPIEWASQGQVNELIAALLILCPDVLKVNGYSGK
jgi:hypothetical protein